MSVPAATPSTERFIICAGSLITPWVCAEDIFEMDRSAAIDWIAAGHFKGVTRVLKFDLAVNDIRDATDDIFDAVCERFADRDEPLSDWAYEFVETHRGVGVARCFARAA